MYSEASILSLENRIGFGSLDIPVIVDPVHRIGSSGREVPFFHRLANLRNIFATVEEDLTTEIKFNDYLAQMKVDATKHVLSSIFEMHKDYISTADYSSLLLERPMLFDDALGYTLAVSAIEQMLTTNRKGIEERNARLSASNLRMELEGLKDSYGQVQSNGLKREQYYAIRNAAEIIFPSELTIKNQPW